MPRKDPSNGKENLCRCSLLGQSWMSKKSEKQCWLYTTQPGGVQIGPSPMPVIDGRGSVKRLVSHQGSLLRFLARLQHAVNVPVRGVTNTEFN